MGELTGVLAVALVFGIPIIAILTAHQRRMAEIIHGSNANQLGPQFQQVVNEIQALRSELNGLRDRVNEQALAHDDLRRSLPTPPRTIE